MPPTPNFLNLLLLLLFFYGQSSIKVLKWDLVVLTNWAFTEVHIFSSE